MVVYDISYGTPGGSTNDAPLRLDNSSVLPLEDHVLTSGPSNFASYIIRVDASASMSLKQSRSYNYWMCVMQGTVPIKPHEE